MTSGENADMPLFESANLEQEFAAIAYPNEGGEAGAGSVADSGSCSTGM